MSSQISSEFEATTKDRPRGWPGGRRRRWLAAALVGAITAAAPAVAQADGSQTFNYSGYGQVFQVPPGVSTIHIVAKGATGGDGIYGSSGGMGAQVTADLPVSPGELFDVWIGRQGASPAETAGSAGGAGGDASGEPGAGGNGGASDIGYAGGGGGGATVLTDLAGNVLLAAGGGGGAASGDVGHGGSGGAGGAIVGDGQNSADNLASGGRGGGSPTRDGAAGAAATAYLAGGGGGGGGGYPAGGAGGSAASSVRDGGGGGGAGDSFVTYTALSASYDTPDFALADGQMTISWTQLSPVTISLKASAAKVSLGSAATFTATVQPPYGAATPTGPVSFVDQTTGQTLGQVALNSSGVATLKTKALAHGTNVVVAQYGGDSHDQSGTSNTVTVTTYSRHVAVSPSPVTFASEPAGAGGEYVQVAVKNTGLDPVKVNGASTSSLPFSISRSSCSNAVVAPGGACVIELAFNPTTAGTFVGTLTVKDNASPGVQTVAVSGTAQ